MHLLSIYIKVNTHNDVYVLEMPAKFDKQEP